MSVTFGPRFSHPAYRQFCRQQQQQQRGHQLRHPPCHQMIPTRETRDNEPHIRQRQQQQQHFDCEVPRDDAQQGGGDVDPLPRPREESKEEGPAILPTTTNPRLPEDDGKSTTKNNDDLASLTTTRDDVAAAATLMNLPSLVEEEGANGSRGKRKRGDAPARDGVRARSGVSCELFGNQGRSFVPFCRPVATSPKTNSKTTTTILTNGSPPPFLLRPVREEEEHEHEEDEEEEQARKKQRRGNQSTSAAAAAEKASPLVEGDDSSSSSSSSWYAGSVSLALPEDDDMLSPLHCFIRKYCVEAFSATPKDVATPRYGKSQKGMIVVGQVGIRCLHCKHLPVHMRPERAICYSSSLKNIYRSIETWRRRHAVACTYIPSQLCDTMAELMQSSRSTAGGRRQYWEDAAKRLGIVDTHQGVRFARPPGLIRESPSSSSSDEGTRSRSSTSSPASCVTSSASPLVTEEDKKLVSDYLFLLMDQMETCEFTEEDRSGGRSKVKDFPVGFPGMQCKHCCGKAGFGRYFPSSKKVLALANSDRNIYNHLRKCRRCPEDVQLSLKELRSDGSSNKNRRGSRQQFFQHVWDRIHHQEHSGSASTSCLSPGANKDARMTQRQSKTGATNKTRDLKHTNSNRNHDDSRSSEHPQDKQPQIQETHGKISKRKADGSTSKNKKETETNGQKHV